MPTTYDGFVVSEHEGKTAQQLLDAPPHALHGLSPADAQALAVALGITSVGDMADDRFFDRARAIQAGAGTPSFDPGPPRDWQAFFEGAPVAHYVNHTAGRFRLHFGPVWYRGRLDGTARVIVVGQDPATNEILSQRVFVGRSGQRVQHLLSKLGLTRSYSMLNTFLFSVFGQFDTELRNISLEPEVLGFRNAWLDRLADENPLEAVITFGRGARHAVEQWPGAAALHVFHLTHPAADDDLVVQTWNTALPGLLAAVSPDDAAGVDPTPYSAPLGDVDMYDIPRHDLGFGVPDWHGVDGGHSTRDGNDKIVWNAP